MRRNALIILAVFALIVSACSGTTETGAAGPSEGITVHGDWVIDVYNADGTLDQHHEFSNALTDVGAQVLADLLSRSASAGLWTVYAGGLAPSESSACENASAIAQPCIISESESGSSSSGGYWFTGLTVTPGTGTSAGTVVLEGAFTATRTGEISVVATYLGTCTADVAPSSCKVLATSYLSSRDLPAATPVADGQQVQVEVTLSFS